jgi:glyoxylase-like metal-dependent hydrolase (beta-lactamase superfamily II)
MQALIPIDCDYLFPQFAASYLLIEGKQAAFIENNTTHSIPLLLKALSANGLTPESVEYVVITHVHLDHAGGSSALMKACPRATLLAHPRAARHIQDPSRLIAGARAVYGNERFEALYGQIEPVAADRVRQMQDGETLKWGSREWTFWHTRGHANHHFCLYDSALRGIFTGDAFGVAYPVLQTAGQFIFPSTSPTDFDYTEAVRSVDKIASIDGDRAFLTHFGEVRNLKAAASQLKDWLAFSQSVLEQARHESDPKGFCQRAIDQRFHEELIRRTLFTPGNWELLRLDRELNAAGLAHSAGVARE